MLNAPGVTFVNPASVFKLMTTVAGGNTSTITLTGDIDPGTPNTGVLELNATNANAKLAISGKFALGTKANPLKAITFSGKGLIGLEQVINTALINLDTPGVAIADINADVNFTNATSKSQLDTGSITGNVNKTLYLTIDYITRKWNMPIQNWGEAMAHFLIKFEGRI